MEILDKSKVELARKYYDDLKNLFVKIYGKNPKESVGIYISDNYVYMASIFFDSGNWHLLSVDKMELPLYNYEEVAAKWANEKIKANDLNNAIVSIGTPDKMLLKKEIELQDIPDENIKEALYWEFTANFFENNEEFNIAYFPLDDGLYFTAALEVKNQRFIDVFFKKEDIVITKWTTFPNIFQLELKGQNIVIFNVNINIPSDIDMTKLQDYAPAIYAAMVGANLFEGEKNIVFPPLYDTEVLNWKLLAATVIFVGIFFMGSVFLYDNLKFKFLNEELNSVNMELKKISADKTRMKIYNDIIKDTKMREKVIAEKTKNRIPFQALILHLGTVTQEGVVLKSVKSEKNRIIIEGEADTEEDLENFLTKINEKKDIFITSPKSLKIENNDEIKFSFAIDL